MLLVLSDFLDSRRGPDQGGGFRVSPTIFLVLVLAGFALGTLGHVIRARGLVIVGITMIFLATVVIPIWLGVTR
jgi:hypothetical protein